MKVATEAADPALLVGLAHEPHGQLQEIPSE